MASVSSSLSIKHGRSLWRPRSQIYRPSRSFVVASSSSFANENREWVVISSCANVSCVLYMYLFVTLLLMSIGLRNAGLWLSEVGMQLDMQLGLSSSTGWPMESCVLYRKRWLLFQNYLLFLLAIAIDGIIEVGLMRMIAFFLWTCTDVVVVTGICTLWTASFDKSLLVPSR